MIQETRSSSALWLPATLHLCLLCPWCLVLIIFKSFAFLRLLLKILIGLLYLSRVFFRNLSLKNLSCPAE